MTRTEYTAGARGLLNKITDENVGSLRRISFYFQVGPLARGAIKHLVNHGRQMGLDVHLYWSGGFWSRSGHVAASGDGPKLRSFLGAVAEVVDKEE